MDHEVEDDIDIERTRGEDGEAMCLEEHGPGEAWERGCHGRVEALEVAGGQDAASLSGQGDEPVGFGERGGERFFDEDVEISLEELRGDLSVSEGGNGDGGGVKPEVSGEQVVDGGEGGDAVESDGVCALSRVGVDGGGEMDRPKRALFRRGCRRRWGFEVAEDTEMVAAEGACADDRYTKRGRHGLFLGRGGFDRLPAAGVEIEELRDLVLWFGGRLDTEAGGGAG